MSLKKTRFLKGIILAPDNISLDAIEGEIKVDSVSGKLQVTLKDGVNPSAAREIVTNSQAQTLTNKTIDASSNTVSNIDVSMLASGIIDTDLTSVASTDTTIPSAKATKTYIDAHINKADDAHTASAITNVPSGNLAATTVQGALNELQGDINSTVRGPTFSQDNAIALFNGTTGKIVKASTAQITSTNMLVGLNSILVQESLATAGSLATSSTTTNSQTGSNVNLSSSTGSVLRLIGSGLVSVGGYNLTFSGRRTVLINNTGASITILNEDASVTAANRIITGTDTSLVIPNLGSFELIYNTATQRHHVLNANSLSIGSIVASQSTFTIANNQSVAANITGLVFNPAVFRGVTIEYSIYRQTSTALSARAQIGQLRFVYNTQAGEWYMSDDYAGQNAGVEFSIDNVTGQIQYTSTNISGTSYVGTLKYSLIKSFGV